MRLAHPLVRLPRPTPMSALELVLLALVAIQGARLVWALLTPVGPVGDWKSPAVFMAPSDSAALGSFDPFFRLESGGSATVTSLDLKLFGVREDRATGRGSAIIALPDGRQMSFAVGDEIMPGVTLAAVGFDSVTINHQGRQEQIFLDQSTAAETVGGAPGVGAAGEPPPPQGAPAVSQPLASPGPPPLPGQAIQFQPRTVNGRINGVAVSPGADSQLFRAAGFAPGDVIVAIDGQPIASVEQARGLVARARGEVTVMVDRGGRAIPMRVRLSQ